MLDGFLIGQKGGYTWHSLWCSFWEGMKNRAYSVFWNEGEAFQGGQDFYIDSSSLIRNYIIENIRILFKIIFRIRKFLIISNLF